LRVEEGLAVSHIHFLAALKVRHAQFVEVVFGDENLTPGEVGLEKGRTSIVAVDFFAMIVCYFVFILESEKEP
jgi:hypothetical protein